MGEMYFGILRIAWIFIPICLAAENATRLPPFTYTLAPRERWPEIINKQWCWLAKSCVHENRYPFICARDFKIRKIVRFKDACAMKIYNCKHKTDYNKMFCNEMSADYEKH